MRGQGSGAIVNCSSLGRLVGLPGRAADHAAKHGVIGLTRYDDLRTRVRDAADCVKGFAIHERPSIVLETHPDEETPSLNLANPVAGPGCRAAASRGPGSRARALRGLWSAH